MLVVVGNRAAANVSERERSKSMGQETNSADMVRHPENGVDAVKSCGGRWLGNLSTGIHTCASSSKPKFDGRTHNFVNLFASR